jgi:hypothetical protein
VSFDPLRIPKQFKKLKLADWNSPLRQDRQEIRLAWLLPGEWKDAIECELRVATIDDCERPRYTALSYVWGNQDDAEMITVNGKLLEVTKNLVVSLRYIRDCRLTRVLWIDAICIQQTNHIEKAWQVYMMGSIFSKCTNAIFWLGEEKEPNDPEPPASLGENTNFIAEAFNFMVYLEEEEHTSSSNLPGMQGTSEDNERQINCIKYGTHILGLRPWWRRIWTLQEAVLPKVAILKCGHHEVNWEIAKNISALIEKHSNCCSTTDYFIYSPFRRQLRHIRNLLQSSRTFIYLYINSISRQSAHDVDRIYGLLGVYKGKLALYPDYDRTMEKLNLLLSTDFLLEGKENRDIFALKQYSSQRHGLPSWYIDFSSSSRWSEHLQTAIRGRLLRKYEASAVLKADLDIDGTLLSSSAHIVGPVHSMKRLPSYKAEDIGQAIPHWYSFTRSRPNAVIIPDDNSVSELWEMFFKKPQHLCSNKLLEWIQTVESICKNPGSIVKTSDILQSLRDIDRAHYNSILYRSTERTIFCTEKGSLGFGPMDMKVNDMIVILHGFPTPIIVRPVKPRDENTAKVGDAQCFELIGDCYVHEMMRGEIVSLDYVKDEKIFIQ